MMAKEVKWIKLCRDFFKTDVAWYLEYKNPLFLIYYMKLILKCKQVESENYGYISLILGDWLCDPGDIACFIDADKKTFEDFLGVAKKLEIVEIQANRVKVIFPWESEPTRQSVLYEHWKNEVLKRDENTCQMCGSKENIIVHHIVPWRVCKDDDDLRYDVDNGVCLCGKCHLIAHNGNWKGV